MDQLWDVDIAGTTFTSPRRKLRELRRAVRDIGAAPAGDYQFEENALFARDEFALTPIETEILLLLLRYQNERRSDQGARPPPPQTALVSNGRSGRFRYRIGPDAMPAGLSKMLVRHRWERGNSGPELAQRLQQ